MCLCIHIYIIQELPRDLAPTADGILCELVHENRREPYLSSRASAPGVRVCVVCVREIERQREKEKREKVRARARESKNERETERQGDRETGRQRETGTERDRDRERQKDRGAHIK